jgi:hypothetical protein
VNSTFSPDYVQALTVDLNNRLWIATFHEVIMLDLNQPLPQTISNEWIQRRTALLVPRNIARGIRWFLLAPLKSFERGALYGVRLIYFGLLAILPLATLGLYWGFSTKNRGLLKTSGFAFLIVLLGIMAFWILAMFIGLFSLD